MTKKKKVENPKNNIVLLGFMGCGKSTIGKLLAENLGMDFIDTDEMIKKQEGMTISKLFELKGEDYFRNLEKESIQTLQEIKGTVISVGGGMPCHFNNMNQLNKIGETIYIKVGKSELAKRLLKDHTRPILDGLDTIKSLEKVVSQKLRERKIYYEEAKTTIMGNTAIITIVNRISKRYTS